MSEKTIVACPACREDGHDKKGNHLAIFPGGKYHCIYARKDKAHNRRIIELRPELGTGMGDQSNGHQSALSSGRIVAEYSYQDASGRELYQVLRKEPKTFLQRHEVNGRWVWNMEGVERVLYRLPKIQTADQVWITEGEKDVEALESCGIIATTSPGGAGDGKNWPKHAYAEALRGKDVVLCGDNDLKGEEYIHAVRASVFPVAKSVRRVCVPAPHKDVSDFVAASGFEQASLQLGEILRAAPLEVAEKQIEISSDLPENYPTNDYGNARRFINQVGNKARYIPERETWIVWDGNHWKHDNDGAIYRMAEDHSTELLRKSADIADKDAQARQAKLALNLGKRAVIENMLALACYNEAAILHAEKLDSNPWLLGVGNGVVDLKTGVFRPGTPADYISNDAGYDYVPGAMCPQFDLFLDRIMGGDSEMISYLWRIIGYCLTGATTEHCLFFFYGSGRNGKSTLIEVLSKLMGRYGRTTAVELITESHYGREPSQLIAALQGKRLVCLPEVEDNQRIAQSRLKTLTGGDRLCGRNLYEKEFEFDCTAKLLIHGNTRPEIRGTDLGIWRRFRLIPFTVTIPENEVDFDLPEKLLLELPGILNRAVEACLDWQQKGIRTPLKVKSATNDYREAEDILGEFLEECTEPSTTARITKGELHRAYVKWSEAKSQRPLSSKRFGSLMAQRGVKEHRTAVAKFWLGIKVQNDRDDAY